MNFRVSMFFFCLVATANVFGRSVTMLTGPMAKPLPVAPQSSTIAHVVELLLIVWLVIVVSITTGVTFAFILLIYWSFECLLYIEYVFTLIEYTHAYRSYNLSAFAHAIESSTTHKRTHHTPTTPKISNTLCDEWCMCIICYLTIRLVILISPLA